MRSDINILWIEDSPKWQKTAEKLFLLKTAEYGLITDIQYISEEIPSLFERIKKEAVGYKKFDIIFVDYNISGNDSNESNTITGDKLIEEFRKYNIDADILFYSENLKESADFQKDEKKKILLNSSVAFEGIYLSNRKDFQENALKLYKKNIRKLTSMLNIRGLLTDKTSENDFVMNSYLLEKFDNLPDDLKQIIVIKLASSIKVQIKFVKNKIEKAEELMNAENYKFKQIYDLPDFILPIANRYQLFSEILSLKDDTTFSDYSINNYQDKIIKIRNAVAHKKIDICKEQKYLKYYDTLKQYNNRACPDDCINHDNNHKISLEDWQQTLKLANDYSKLFDKILNELEKGDSK